MAIPIADQAPERVEQGLAADEHSGEQSDLGAADLKPLSAVDQVETTGHRPRARHRHRANVMREVTVGVQRAWKSPQIVSEPGPRPDARVGWLAVERQTSPRDRH